MRTPTRVYTVPAGKPFLDALAQAILTGNLPAPGGTAPSLIDLPAITLMMPTRRAARTLQEAFLRASGGRAMLLPAIRPISEGDEDASLLAEAAGSSAGSSSIADVAPSISELQRRLALTTLVLRWSEAERTAGRDGAPVWSTGTGTPAQAAQLAKELGRLMDMVETEGASFDRIAELVPEAFSEHWQKTLRFLEIVTRSWPHYLNEQGLLSPADRRNRLILAEAARLRSAPPQGPVIVAGVTGSIPATVELMRTVQELPNGAIVLPALDTTLDEESWQAIVPAHPEHPQFGLKKLLDALSVTRSDVSVLPGAEAQAREAARLELVSETMRPAATTERWHGYAKRAAADDKTREALEGLSLVEAPGAQDEAEAIALILREAAETPGRTAALVSPDRLLARRVAVRLESWGIRVDDSAGRPFGKTVPGAFLNLVIETIGKGFAPPVLMALLKHPLTRLGLNPFEVRRAARALEIGALRAPYLGSGLDGVEAALERAIREAKPDGGARRHMAVRRLWEADWAGARDLVLRLKAAFTPLVEAFNAKGSRPLREFARAHAETGLALSRLPETEEGVAGAASQLWRGEAGEAASRFFQSLEDAALPDLPISRHDYPDLYRSLIHSESIRPRLPVHPRLSIWGPFEARLQQPDVVVLGSLNDGTWPQSAEPGPWLNRPMRQGLGLPSPEERIGHAAHDFATLLAAPQVILTRAEKIDGVPAVPSRWLLRLEALLAGMGQLEALKPKQPWLGWARHRDHIAKEKATRIRRPEPRPPVDLRPRKLSVSRIETWIGNPYAIFAREILDLEPLDALGLPPQPSLRGSIIHEALSRFAKAYPASLPSDIESELVRFARGILDEYAAHPRIAAFWVPRFERFAAWFAATEPTRRTGIEKIVSETNGSLTFGAPGGPFKLTARADRIDVAPDGIIITDYKTGKPPESKRLIEGTAPQLPLEAAIALGLEDKAGFENVPPGPVSALRFIRASGAEPPGEEQPVKVPDIAALASEQLGKLKKLVAAFDQVATPYAPLRRRRFSYQHDSYAHLARVAEWSQGWGQGEDS
jgi:ATP-dependent helicase/nuclease subunit B